MENAGDKNYKMICSFCQKSSELDSRMRGTTIIAVFSVLILGVHMQDADALVLFPKIKLEHGGIEFKWGVYCVSARLGHFLTGKAEDNGLMLKASILKGAKAISILDGGVKGDNLFAHAFLGAESPFGQSFSAGIGGSIGGSQGSAVSGGVFAMMADGFEPPQIVSVGTYVPKLLELPEDFLKTLDKNAILRLT